ncbi:MAG TPA: hypothetical protein VMX57_04605 [Planctomycetota bacterium]|nr:hypothetical protein [Planctomycetota bacterium]
MSVDSVTLLGNLTAGPQGVCEGGFPSGVLQVAFGLAGSCPGAGTKPALRKFWTSQDVNSPSSFAGLDGVGVGQSVTQANTLYLRTTTAMLFRLTFADPAAGPDFVSVIPVKGLLILEPSEAGYLKLLEVQGAGKVEYFASGNL